jgi:hypothetical protein
MGLDLTSIAVAKSYVKESLNGAGAIKGEKGDKGDPFTYDDFTSEQLESLKGQPGKDGIDGKNGLDGADGQDGITYTPQIGTITTVPSSENASASVDIDEESHTASFNFEIPKGEDGISGGSGEFPDLYTTTEIPAAGSITEDDKLLLGTSDGNRTVTADNFVKFVMDNIDIPDIESPVKVPLVKGYSVVVKDYDTVIAKNTRSVVLFNFSDLGLNIDDVVSIEVLTLQSAYTIALDHYINHETKDFYIIHYAGDNVSTPCTLTVRVCLLVKDSSVKEDSGRVGEIIAYMGTTAPLNYLSCDGAEYNISDFPYLAQHFKTAFGSVNHFGGDGETTFAVPDLRGEFLMGTGENSHENSITKILEGSGGAVGEHQESTVFPMSGAGVNPSGTGYFGGMGGYSNTISSTDSRNEDTKIGNSIGVYYGTNVNNGSDYKGVPTIHTARPTNTAVMWCIRYLDTVNGVSETTPLLKGIRAITIPVDTAFVANVQSIVVGNVSDYGISVNNVIGCCGSLALDRGTTNERVATAVIGVLSTGQLVIRESSGYAPTARIKMDGVITLFVRDLDIEDITLDDLPAATEITETDKLLLGQDAQNKSIEMSGFMDFMRENGLFDLDGKGRPLLPGYGIVTKSVTLNIPAGSILVCDTGISITDFGVTDIVDVFAISKELNWPFYPYISKGNITLYNPQSCPAFNNVSAIIGAIYKQKVPYEPGLKTVKYTKTVDITTNASKSAGYYFTTLEDIDPSLKLKDIVSVQVVVAGSNIVTNVMPILKEDEFRLYCPMIDKNYGNQTFDFIFTVKDYSSIGSAIVTEGIRMITRKVSFTAYGESMTMILRESDLDVAFEDIIAVDFKSDSLDGYTGYAVLNVPEKKIELITRANTGNGQTFSGVLSYIVKVPVVEPRKPFVKDVDVALSGTNGIPTGIILDGSEEVGGYTVENISSITAIPITIGMWINPPTIGQNNQIFLTKQYSSSDGKCSVRIRIE